MKKNPCYRLCHLLVLVVCSVGACQIKNTPDPLPPLTLTIQPIVTNVEGPTAMAFPEKDVIWLLLQKGLIRVIKNGKLIDTPLLDLRGKMIEVNDGYEERGLLGIALHPGFKTNGKFYLFYSAPSSNGSNHKDVVAEYRLSPSGVVDPGSARIILSAEKPDGNHNGGCLQFGPDGYLYIVDRLNAVVRKVDAASNVMTTVAGNGRGGAAAPLPESGTPAVNAGEIGDSSKTMPSSCRIRVTFHEPW